LKENKNEGKMKEQIQESCGEFEATRRRGDKKDRKIVQNKS
jgi:hypothetical protein